MKIKNTIIFIVLLFLFEHSNAQDDLLNQLDTVKSSVKDIAPAAFKGLQICNMQSTKLAAKGELYILISHRFGDLNQGLDNFFGLDNALTKIGALYGVKDWLQLGVTRQTYNKIYELTAKYKFANQINGGFPFTIVGYNTLDINSGLKKDLFPNIQFKDRLAFSSQFLVSRKFSDALSFEVNAIYVHKNLYEPSAERKDQFLLATGGRCKLTKRMSVNLEYAVRFRPVTNPSFHDPLTLGLDIETGGHVFQMVFSNSQPMNDVAVYTNAAGKWNGGAIYFGFNVYRVF